MLRHLEGFDDMATLSARRPAGLLALTLGCPGLIFARWLTGGRAVLRLPCFEDLEPSEKLSHMRFEFTVSCLEALTLRTGDFADVLLWQGNRATPLSSYHRRSLDDAV